MNEQQKQNLINTLADYIHEVGIAPLERYRDHPEASGRPASERIWDGKVGSTRLEEEAIDLFWEAIRILEKRGALEAADKDFITFKERKNPYNDRGIIFV